MPPYFSGNIWVSENPSMRTPQITWQCVMAVTQISRARYVVFDFLYEVLQIIILVKCPGKEERGGGIRRENTLLTATHVSRSVNPQPPTTSFFSGVVSPTYIYIYITPLLYSFTTTWLVSYSISTIIHVLASPAVISLSRKFNGGAAMTALVYDWLLSILTPLSSHPLVLRNSTPS